MKKSEVQALITELKGIIKETLAILKKSEKTES